MASSKALTQFSEQLSVAAALVDLEGKYPDPPPSDVDRTAARGLRGGSVVLSVAAFENFLKEAITEHLAVLATDPPRVPFEKLPKRLRLSSVFASLEQAISGPRYGAGASDREARLSEVQLACRSVSNGLISPSALASTGGNPSADRVKGMFLQLDIVNLFSDIKSDFELNWGKPEAKTFVADKLNEIVGLRHKVAHTADTLTITRAQLRETLRFLSTLAAILDQKLHDHVAAILCSAKSNGPATSGRDT